MGVLYSFSVKNIFYDKMDLSLFYFDVANYNSLLKADFRSYEKKTIMSKLSKILSRKKSHNCFCRCQKHTDLRKQFLRQT